MPATESIGSLSLEEKVGRLFFIGIGGTAVDAGTASLLDEIKPGGVCLFSRNIKDAAETRRLLDGIRSHLSFEPLLSIDQEGGLVDRLRRVVTPMPAASEFKTVQDVQRSAQIAAETLRILGFNMNFAPVVDVIDGERSEADNGLRSRAFGHSVEQVVDLAGAFLNILQHDGCLGCIKHFPGLGAARVDSHEELPLVDIAEQEFFDKDISPYKDLMRRSDVYAVMVAHAAYPQLGLQESSQDGRLLPASLSRAMITGLLRNEFGFDGVVITDDLEMGAIIRNYGIGEGCKMAVSAGADMLAICAGEGNIREGFRAVIDAVNAGEITEERIDESVRRISNLQALAAKPLPLDIERLSRISDEIAQLKESLK